MTAAAGAPPRTELRRATIADLGALTALEEAGFDEMDRFTRSHLRYLLTRANATTLVIERGEELVASAVLLWRRNSSVARLYSIVTHPSARGEGLGRRMLEACEEEAAKHGRLSLSLEVRPGNELAKSFYERHGYVTVRRIRRFYDDGGSALQMVKQLENVSDGLRMAVPYYAQTLDFTCGPACLLMAMRFLNVRTPMSRGQELVLWKEATLIFMTSGLGGCGPFGLAIAAQRRGFQASVLLSDRRVPFLSSVRSEEKKSVITLVHQQLRKEAAQLGVGIDYGTFHFDDIRNAMVEGVVPIVLISTYRLHRIKAPHWVVVTGFDDTTVYFHDPYEGFYEDDPRKAQHLGIPIREFDRMRRYGKDVQKSVVFVGKRY